MLSIMMELPAAGLGTDLLCFSLITPGGRLFKSLLLRSGAQVPKQCSPQITAEKQALVLSHEKSILLWSGSVKAGSLSKNPSMEWPSST